MRGTNRLAVGLMVALTTSICGSAAHAKAAACEDVLKELRAKLESAKPADADKAAFDALMAEGIERCNADDDKRADDRFAQAMALLGK